MKNQTAIALKIDGREYIYLISENIDIHVTYNSNSVSIDPQGLKIHGEGEFEIQHYDEIKSSSWDPITIERVKSTLPKLEEGTFTSSYTHSYQGIDHLIELLQDCLSQDHSNRGAIDPSWEKILEWTDHRGSYVLELINKVLELRNEENWKGILALLRSLREITGTAK